jgi:hypothetical protein
VLGRLSVFQDFQAVAQFVENGGAFAKDRVHLDKLLVGGDQLADVFPAVLQVQAGCVDPDKTRTEAALASTGA